MKSNEEPIVSDSSDENTDDDAVTNSNGNDNGVQNLTGKKSSWQKLCTLQTQRGHLQQQNVANFMPGPTTFETNRVIISKPIFLRLIFSQAMLKNIQKCTPIAAQHVTGNVKWNVTLYKLDKFIGLIINTGVLGHRGLHCSSL